jgi:dTDP-4-dehydrorhamnose reductase
MKYLILGGAGYVGKAFLKTFNAKNMPYKSLSRSEVNYYDKIKLREYINSKFLHLEKSVDSKITIINCAGFVGKPNVDACENNKEECFEANSILPFLLSSLCKEEGYNFCHISSGCIYNGYKKTFCEEDQPNFNFNNGSFYSGSKAFGEKLVLKLNPDSYIFRLRIPFNGENCKRNYLTKLLSYDRLINMQNSLSHLGDFVEHCIELIAKQAPKGIYNITNKGSIDAQSITCMMKKHLKIKKEFKFFSNLDYFMQEITAPRSNCILDTSKVEQYVNIRNVEEAVENSIIELGKNEFR